ncbi:MAG TPA: malto-oligosyltrehalose synthase [Thermoanaerobaculia bacterium]|nr:malto-oligosyltrehalose synthase [Thermoanaerobaculia bacterium]
MYRLPIATYRFQFHSGFTFDEARQLLPYLKDLGITDVYSSPVLRARTGSTHGYDVVDASMVNPELGGEEQFLELQNELQRLELGFVLDIVPNHMAASPENGWWISVLENGPHSRFFHYFDIDWSPVATQGKVVNKVVLPILGKPYGEAVESQEIQLGYDEHGLHFRYYDRRLPLSPDSYLRVIGECVESLPNRGVAMELREIVKPSGTTDLQPNFLNSRFLKETLHRLYETEESFRRALDETITRINGETGVADSFNLLDELLDAQWFRLAYWRIASEKINYRRFFDVADLVGIRVENPEVFEARHKRIFQFVADGHVTGLRIDHIDGLYDPVGHLRKLQMRLASGEPTALTDAQAGQTDKHFFVIVEKILAHDETLPHEMAASGTTGYDFLDTLNAVFVAPEGVGALDRFYRDLTGIEESFDDMTYDRKKQVIQELFAGEMRALGKRLGELSMHDRNARDFAPSELLAALLEITASMDVYRTYIRDVKPLPWDADFIRRAVSEARDRAGTSLDERLFTFLERVLLVDPPSYISGERERWLAFVMRWQQFTGRVMAKGVEDTAFYNYNRLISLNEVGGEPGRTSDFDPVEEFHVRNERVIREWPDTMNATSTHDTKRSEDVRARISVLSEIPDVWEREVRRWRVANARLRSGDIPDANEELLIYQTLLGMWPVDEEEVVPVPERLRAYLEKAAREAKTHTSWIAPDAEYEKAYLDFATAILGNEDFFKPFIRLQRRVAFHGFLNALSQVVLKIGAPGFPDFYQGTEMWDLTLVDPDNRRPVDYDRRRATLKKLKASAERGALDLGTMLRRSFDGRAKMYVTWRGLELRKERAASFQRGAYTRLKSESKHVVAFLRGEDVIVAAPRLTTSLVKPGVQPVGDVWGKATLEGIPEGSWRNVFTGETLESDGSPVRLADVFATFPAALLALS